MRTQLFVCLAFVATLALAKNATVGWQIVIPNTPSLITPISATTEKLYLFTSADSIMALNISNGAFIWSYGGFGTLALELSPLSVLHDRIPKVTYPNFVSTKNNTVTQYYVDVLYADSGTLLSRTKNISFFTSAVLNSDYLIVTSPPAGNSSTQNVTAFDIGTGKQRWVLPELAWFTTQSAVAADGVLIAVGVYLPYPQNKANPVSFAVHAFSEDTGAAFWTVPCTLFVADTATSVNASTTGAMYSERRRRLTKVDGGLLAVVNITNAVSPLNFSSTLFILSRTWGITLAALPLAHNQIITSGSFISGDRLVFTDGLTVLSCVDVAAQKFLWNTSLWIDPAFHPFSDVVSSISEAGDQILVQFTPAVSPTTNVSAPQPLNVTAFDSKTGKMQGSVVFPDSNALVLTPLLDGRLLVQSYRAGGFQVYSLLTGELIADYSWPTLAVGSVQLVRPGVVVGVDSTTDVAYQVFP